MKRTILSFSIILILLAFISSCAEEITKETPTKEEIETQPPIVLEEKPIEKPELAEEEIVQESSIREKCSRIFSPKFSAGSYYNGPLFDAHFHMPTTFDLRQITEEQGHEPSPTNYVDPILDKDVTLDEILCFFDKEDVRGAIGFYIPNPLDLDESIRAAKDIKQQSSDRVNLFLMPGLLDAQSLDNLQNDNLNLFKGYGELAFYSQEMAGYTPSSNKFLQIYGVADKHNLVVMIHPGSFQKDDIEKALQNNPDVNFLLHGFEIENDVTGLMDKYANVYFSIDSAVLYPMMGLFISGPKEEFVSKFKQDFDSMLNQRINKWKKEIEKHPDRFVWGTDRGPKWHFDEEISVLFEEFARAFIGRLDPTVQEKFAYKNAERLIAGG